MQNNLIRIKIPSIKIKSYAYKTTNNKILRIINKKDKEQKIMEF